MEDMLMSNKLSNKTKNQIERLYSHSDLAIHEICAILNVCPKTIANVIEERNIPKRNSPLSDSEINLAINMYEKGYYLQDIFDTIDITPSLLYQEIDKRNIQRRRINTRPRKKNYNTPNKHTDAVIELYNKGKRGSDISRELSISHSTVSSILKKAKDDGLLQTRSCDIEKAKEKERINDIATLYHLLGSNKKITIRKIAQVMNVSEHKLYYAIRNQS